MDCSTNSQLPHTTIQTGSGVRRILKHGSADQLPLHTTMTNKFKVKKKESYAYTRRKDNQNPVPKLEECLISFCLAGADSDAEVDEEPPGSPNLVSSLDYLRRPYARIGRLPNVPRPSSNGAGYPVRKSNRPPRKSNSDDDIASTFKRSFSTEDLVFPLSSRSIDDPTTARLPSVRELLPISEDVKQSNQTQFNNVSLNNVSNFQASPSEDQMLNILTSKFMQFGNQNYQ